jgi:hypothetical protein
MPTTSATDSIVSVSLPRGLGVLCVALALAAAGCGGGGDGGGSSSSKTPDEWASTVCGALDDWGKSIQAGSQDLRPAMENTKDLENVKEKYIGFLEDAEQSSQKLVDEVKSAGPPETEEGQAVQSELVSALEKVQKSFARAVDRAEELSTNDGDSLRSGVGALSNDVEKNLQAAGAFFNGIGERSPEIKEAMDDTPSCGQFANAG